MGCGSCVSICPEVFELGADGKAQVKAEADLEKFSEKIAEAVASCPTGAITQE